MINLQIAENLLIKLLLNRIILKNYNNDIINELFNYNGNDYTINGTLNGQIHILNNTYQIINNILVDINDNNNFIISNNINYFKYNYNTN